jgi:hypothetical protein
MSGLAMGSDDRQLFRAISAMCTYASILGQDHKVLAGRVVDSAANLLRRRASFFSPETPFRSQQPLGPN